MTFEQYIELSDHIFMLVFLALGIWAFYKAFLGE